MFLFLSCQKISIGKVGDLLTYQNTFNTISEAWMMEMLKIKPEKSGPSFSITHKNTEEIGLFVGKQEVEK